MFTIETLLDKLNLKNINVFYLDGIRTSLRHLRTIAKNETVRYIEIETKNESLTVNHLQYILSEELDSKIDLADIHIVIPDNAQYTSIELKLYT